MRIHPSSILRNHAFRLALLCFAVLSWTGCAYFRWGDPSYKEIQQRTEEEKSADKMNFDPTKVFEKKAE